MGGRARTPDSAHPASLQSGPQVADILKITRATTRDTHPFGGTNKSMINLAGKTAVVFGLANKRSIAWGIAQKLHQAGATLAICYQNERMKAEAEDLINDLSGADGFQCDVSNDAEIESLFTSLQAKYGKIDTLVHAIAYAPAEDLKGEFINTSRDGFRIAHDVSVYSLIAVSRGAVPL